MAYNFDSEFYPMMVRVEAQTGIIVHFDENSDYEGVFRVEIDSDYIVGIIDNRIAAVSGLDSDQVENMINEHSKFTDSDLGVIATLRNEVDALKLDTDSDSTKLQALQIKVDFIEASLDSDQTVSLDLIRRIDSDALRISDLTRNADSDASTIKELVGTLDSDGRLLEKVLQAESDIVKLRSDLDSESTQIRLLRKDVDSDTLDMNDVIARLDSDELKVQDLERRLAILEFNVDSDRLWTRNEVYNQIEPRLNSLEDSDYYDSDRVVRTIALNRLDPSDSDSLLTAIKNETGSHLSRIITLENLLGVGAAASSSSSPSDSDLNTVEYTQTGSTLSQTTQISWYVYSLGGGEIIRRTFTIAKGSPFTSILRTIAFTVNTDSVAMNYFDRFVVDYDQPADTDDKIHFRFKTGFEDMAFDAVVDITADNGKIKVTQ